MHTMVLPACGSLKKDALTCVLPHNSASFLILAKMTEVGAERCSNSRVAFLPNLPATIMNSDRAPFLLLAVCELTRCFHQSHTVSWPPKEQAHRAQEKASQYASLAIRQATSKWSTVSGSWSHSKHTVGA
jgi:hypothetical protein